MRESLKTNLELNKYEDFRKNPFSNQSALARTTKHSSEMVSNSIDLMKERILTQSKNDMVPYDPEKEL